MSIENTDGHRELDEGDALIVLEGAPAVVRVDREAEIVVFLLPSAPLGALQALRDANVVLETRRSSTVSILGHLLCALSEEHLNGRSVGDFPQQLAALVRLHFQAIVHSDDSNLWTESEQVIEGALWDPDLDPAYVARAVHASLRTLHRVFRAQGTSLSAWIRHRRLEHCREDLEDLAMSEVSVRTIGARWGLHDPAHFSRLFKSEYGQSPGSYRRSWAQSRQSEHLAVSGAFDRRTTNVMALAGNR
ncbi:helix-turn-helix domain-containing protein [Microbacterium sp. W4I4]|uniref:helix-turn-helix domain-containing protein n=1 Tax=Microbacterium sp. W4I4 TaxID=3042295 RepID=UPI0027D90F79|nr:helix-turn-helix domain-containing protein [Microbacterium sp. W4I4]